MAIASFQKKVFQVSATSKYPLDGLGWSSALNTEAQEKLNAKPSTYIKGGTLSPLSFTVPLLTDLGINVRKEIESWEAIMNAQTADYFILGSKPIGKNKWLLKTVSVSDTVIDGKGYLRKANLKLDFEEYVRAGKAEEKKDSKTALTTGNNITPTSYIDKTADKRINPNASEAYNRLLGKGGF